VNLSHQTPGPNMGRTAIGGTTVLFSYGLCIAYTTRDGGGAFNPDARGVSTTTAKHATALGVKRLPDAASAAAFAEGLRLAILADLASGEA